MFVNAVGPDCICSSEFLLQKMVTNGYFLDFSSADHLKFVQRSNGPRRSSYSEQLDEELQATGCR